MRSQIQRILRLEFHPVSLIFLKVDLIRKVSRRFKVLQLLHVEYFESLFYIFHRQTIFVLKLLQTINISSQLINVCQYVSMLITNIIIVRWFLP